MADGTTQPAVTSKINWLGLITVAGSVTAYVAAQIDAKTAIAGIVVGALNIIFRSFFTTTTISGVFTTPTK